MMRITDFFLELTSTCNFTCAYCPSSGILQRKQELASLCHVERVASQLASLIVGPRVHLWLMGEPCCHPQFTEACAILHRHGISYDVATNGALLSPVRLEALLSLNPSEIFISIQSPSPQHFTYRDSKQSFEAYIGSLDRLVETFVRQVEAGGVHTRLMLKFLLQCREEYYPSIPFISKREDLAELAVFLHRLLPQSVNEWWLRDADEYPPQRETCIAPQLFLCFDQVGTWSDWPDQIKVGRSKEAPRRCPQDHTLGILCDGRYVLCCLDYNGRTAFADVDCLELSSLFAECDRDALMRNALCAQCLARNG
jgi:hypothetical protein